MRLYRIKSCEHAVQVVQAADTLVPAAARRSSLRPVANLLPPVPSAHLLFDCQDARCLDSPWLGAMCALCGSACNSGAAAVATAVLVP